MLAVGLDDPVLIIGAGICGLTIAQGLQESNIPFLIFDARNESDLSSDTWPVTLQSSLPLLKSLLPKDVADRLETHAGIEYSLSSNLQKPTGDFALTGDERDEPDSRDQQYDRYLSVNKAKLRALFREGIFVQHEYILESVELTDHGKIVAVFANGERQAGAFLIGADGSHSLVRGILLGKERSQLNPIDATYVHTNFRYHDAQKAQIVGSVAAPSRVSVHNGCTTCLSILEMSDAGRPETWQFHLSMAWKAEGAAKGMPSPCSFPDRMQELKAKAQTLKEPFSSAVLWIPDDVEIQYDDLATWTPTVWHTRGGRLTLAGDAAHSMPLNNTSGLDSAIVDAYKFVDTVRSIASGTRVRAEAIPSYSKEVAARGAKDVELSRYTVERMLDKSSSDENRLVPCETALVSTIPNIRSRKQLPLPAGQRASQQIRRAWSHARLWITNGIENLDRGAQQGTAQTGWVDVGRREYGRRHFPSD